MRDPLALLNSSPQLRQASLRELFKRPASAVQDLSYSSDPYHSCNDSLLTHISQETADDEPIKKRRRQDVIERQEASEIQSAPRTVSRLARHRRATSTQDVLASMQLQSRYKSTMRDVFQSNLISSYASHDQNDVYRCLSINQDRHYAIPFAIATSNESKRGGKQLAVIGTEEGYLCIRDLSMAATHPTDHGVHAHDNAIFDVKWSADDRRIATASGDQSIRIFDVEYGKQVIAAQGHTCTVKQIQWDPFDPNCLASGSRDGTVRIWDVRQPYQSDDAEFDSITAFEENTVYNAHGDHLKKKMQDRKVLKSVTSITYLEHRDNLIASAGSHDSVIKVWDLRKALFRRINPPALQQSPDHSFLNGVNSRTNGISSIVLSQDKTELYTVSTNGYLIAIDAQDVSRPQPLKTFNVTPAPLRQAWQGLEASEFRTKSFYIKLANSTDGRILAAGTQDGTIWMWDVNRPQGGDVHVKGHSSEICAVDFSTEGMLSASDDALVRFWRPNIYTKTAYERGGVEARNISWQTRGYWKDN